MNRKAHVVVLVLAMLLSLGANSTNVASQSRLLPRNGKIAYDMRDKEGHSRVYLVEADGRNPTFLVDGSIAGWSPDGKQLLLDGGQKVLALDTGKITPVFPDSRAGEQPIGSSPPVWSPDGTQIAVVSKFALYIVKLNGTRPALIYRFGREHYTKRRFILSWSPDSQWLTFPLFGKPMSAYIIGANGNGLAMLRNSANVYPHAWSPDGRFVFGLLESSEHWGLNTVVAIDVKTGKVTQLTESIKMNYSIVNDYNLALSPDGKKLAYAEANGPIYAVPIDGGLPSKITEELLDIGQVQWSPDGKQLIMTCGSLRDAWGSICIVNADGTNPRVLVQHSEEIGYGSPAWQPLVDQ